jgi:hypothetical protein
MVLIPYVIYLNSLSQSYSETNRLTLAKNSVEKLGQTVDWIYSLGEGAQTKIEILVPEGVESIEFIGKLIVWRVKTSAGTSDVYYISVTNVTGSLPSTAGYKNVLVKAWRDCVNVSAG